MGIKNTNYYYLLSVMAVKHFGGHWTGNGLISCPLQIYNTKKLIIRILQITQGAQGKQKSYLLKCALCSGLRGCTLANWWRDFEEFHIISYVHAYVNNVILSARLIFPLIIPPVLFNFFCLSNSLFFNYTIEYVFLKYTLAIMSQVSF